MKKNIALALGLFFINIFNNANGDGIYIMSTQANKGNFQLVFKDGFTFGQTPYTINDQIAKIEGQPWGNGQYLIGLTCVYNNNPMRGYMSFIYTPSIQSNPGLRYASGQCYIDPNYITQVSTSTNQILVYYNSSSK